MNLEEFKQVEGFTDYLISEYGRVWDKRQNKELKWIKNNTFNCVNMYNAKGKKELVKIHHAVAKTYLVKPEEATNIVLHKDLDRDNNHYTNLEWKIKGVSNKAHLRYSIYHGVKYHLTELEEISEKSGLPLWTVRNRLEDGYTVNEIYQGYKDSDVYWVDGVMFIGELAVRRYKEEKARKLRADALKQKRDREEKERVEKEERMRLTVEKRGTEDSKLISAARDALSDMKVRCYSDFTSPRYDKNYFGRGVVVCDQWNHDSDIFINWYNRNYIEGWEIDKDIIPLYEGRSGLEYSEENCCFVPKWINHWFAKVGEISIVQNSKSFVFDSKLTTATRGSSRLILRGDNREDVFEQYLLTKDLQFEKRVWETLVGYELLRKRKPKTPKIHPTLISIISNYSTAEYLRLRNISLEM